MQEWHQKFSDRGSGTLDKGAKMAKNPVFVRYFAKFPLTLTQDFLRLRGGAGFFPGSTLAQMEARLPLGNNASYL